MAINAYVGLPGSGKSYSVVENVILPALKDGKRVWTNIPLDLELIAAEGLPIPTLFNLESITDDPEFFQNVFEAGATIVIDECWRFWPSGMKATNMLEGHKSFFAEHRHMVGEDGHSTDIALVTQDLSQIAATVRNLVEATYRTVKLNSVGASNKFRVDVYEGAVTGPKPPESQRLRQLFGSYKKEVYQFYQSQTMNASDSHGAEGASDGRMNILNSNWLKFGAPAFLIVMGFFIYTGLSSVSTLYNGEEQPIEDKPRFEKRHPPGRIEEIPVEVPADPRLIALLDGVEVYITYNNGHYPWIDYVFALENETRSSSVSLHQMRTAGFQVEPITQCLALIINRSIITKAMCRENEVDDYQPEQPDAFASVADISFTGNDSE